MFDVGFSELVLIALLALIVLGPKRLPEAARAAGRWVGKLRRFVSDVKQDFDRELHSAELEELRKLKQEMTDARRVFGESVSQFSSSIDPEAGSAVETPASSARLPPPVSVPPEANADGKSTQRAPRKNARAGQARKR